MFLEATVILILIISLNNFNARYILTKRKREKKRGKREAREREGKIGRGKIKKNI